MDKDELLAAMDKARKVKTVLNQSGWTEVKSILEGLKTEALSVLEDEAKDEDRHSARGIVKAVTRIVTDLDYTARQGEEAEKEYKQRFGPI